MMFGVIDVGSNSVRLMISDGKNTIEKLAQTTRLAEGMGSGKVLQKASIERSVIAIAGFIEYAKNKDVDKFFVFATAAVRQAKNKQDFINAVKQSCRLDVDVVSGENEALFGLLGTLNGKNGAIIDVGGASSEIAVVENNKLIYSKSLPIGAVILRDNCGQDLEKGIDFVENTIKDYGVVPKSEFYSIGGTATSIASIMQELEPYAPTKTDGFKIYYNALFDLTNKLYSMTVEERRKLKGLQKERAEVIAGGALILLKIMEKIGAEYIIVSEKDNLEGYLMNKMERL